MNLGIKREVIGDIFIIDNIAFLFCLNSMTDYICKNLNKVKHTSVICSITTEIPPFEKAAKIEKIIQASSERIDGIISKIYNLSRSQCSLLFTMHKIFVNGKLCENSSLNLKIGDIITVRGFGRSTYLGISGTSRKEKLNIKIQL